MIVVATADFEVYHGTVAELRERGVQFTTIEPDDVLPEETRAVITGPDEDLDLPVPVVRATPEEPRKAVEEILTLLRGGGGRTIVGIDPGERPGIAVLVGETIVAAFHVPIANTAEVVIRELEGTADPLVRIGDGARLQGSRIIDDLGEITIELVDETGTTPYLGSGARGMGDVLAAVNIAQLEGEVVESRSIEPTEGEIRIIQTKSRERSEGNRAITETLARQVAAGELTIEEALAQHERDLEETEE